MADFALSCWFNSIVGYLESSVDMTDEQSDTKSGNRLLCFRCHQVITDRGKCITVKGARTHNCLNPAAINYHFGCFREALGVQ